jgi:ribosomal protein S18 acetylase RimI-like enzyme
MFRTATLSDFDVVLNFSLQLKRLAEQSNPNVWKITQEGIENKRQSIRQMITDEDACIILAESAGQVIGFISGLIRTREDYTPTIIGQIAQLYIIEPWRRQGIGTRLLKELLVFFEEQQVEQIVVNYIAGNKVGETFWNKFDFNPVHISSNIPLGQLKKKFS